MAGARAADARIVGKVNLHELAFGATGVNEWYGTPVNPLDPALVPGGSSSGSAVAVATGEADVAYGSDTGGSVRIPSACCGTVGLKTTWGRIPLDGVWLLAESLDTVGPMAADVAGVVTGMRLLEPGFEPGSAPTVVGRLRQIGDADPAIDAAVDAALAAAELEVVDIGLPSWATAFDAVIPILVAEAWRNDGSLLERDADNLGRDVRASLRLGATIGDDALAAARTAARAWAAEIPALFSRVQLLALPTMPCMPVALDADPMPMIALTAPVNLAGNPALALPIPSGG